MGVKNMAKNVVRNWNENAMSLAEEYATYIVLTGATIRQTAKRFHVSKSTVHDNIERHLRETNFELYKKVRIILDKNKAERHIRGGMATKRKYSKL